MWDWKWTNTVGKNGADWLARCRGTTRLQSVKKNKTSVRCNKAKCNKNKVGLYQWSKHSWSLPMTEAPLQQDDIPAPLMSGLTTGPASWPVKGRWKSHFQRKFPCASPFVKVTLSASEGAPRPWLRPSFDAFSGFNCSHTPASRPQSTYPGLWSPLPR